MDKDEPTRQDLFAESYATSALSKIAQSVTGPNQGVTLELFENDVTEAAVLLIPSRPNDPVSATMVHCRSRSLQALPGGRQTLLEPVTPQLADVDGIIWTTCGPGFVAVWSTARTLRITFDMLADLFKQ